MFSNDSTGFVRNERSFNRFLDTTGNGWRSAQDSASILKKNIYIYILLGNQNLAPGSEESE